MSTFKAKHYFTTQLIQKHYFPAYSYLTRKHQKLQIDLHTDKLRICLIIRTWAQNESISIIRICLYNWNPLSKTCPYNQAVTANELNM